MKFNKKVILLILDGWGIGKKDKFNAIDNAKKPNFDRLIREYANVQLKSDGLAVGLPEGQCGTSEINHQVLGSGRIVLQDLPRINDEISKGTFFNNSALIKTCEHVRNNNSSLHIISLVSDGGIHSAMNHLEALIDLAKEQKINKLYFHVITDGRDTPPKSAEKYLVQLEEMLKKIDGGKIATMQGRFYLDRDRDWAKTEKAVNLLTKGEGNTVHSYQAAINLSYNKNTTDEFFDQFILDSDGVIKENDAVIFAHYRSDRLYQIVKSLLDCHIKNLLVTTFIEVSSEIKTLVSFPRPEMNDTLSEIVSANNKTQYHITETEKYTHLTYFFNGGAEKELPGEKWELFESNRYVKPYYNIEPSMRSFIITQKIVEKIAENKTDLIIINFPNADMVGHTGNYEAAVVAVEALDYCIGKIYEAIKDHLDEYALLITADHGNADEMWDYKNNQPHTQHTLSQVPLILVSNINCKLDRRESLQDVAPTILTLMGIAKPDVMTGDNLIILNK